MSNGVCTLYRVHNKLHIHIFTVHHKNSIPVADLIKKILSPHSNQMIGIHYDGIFRFTSVAMSAHMLNCHVKYAELMWNINCEIFQYYTMWISYYGYVICTANSFQIEITCTPVDCSSIEQFSNDIWYENDEVNLARSGYAVLNLAAIGSKQIHHVIQKAQPVFHFIWCMKRLNLVRCR